MRGKGRRGGEGEGGKKEKIDSLLIFSNFFLFLFCLPLPPPLPSFPLPSLFPFLPNTSNLFSSSSSPSLSHPFPSTPPLPLLLYVKTISREPFITLPKENGEENTDERAKELIIYRWRRRERKEGKGEDWRRNKEGEKRGEMRMKT